MNKLLRFISWHLGIWNKWYREEKIRREYPSLWRHLNDV